MITPAGTTHLDLTGRLILVTGGLGALGQGIVTRLREHGAQLVVNDVLDADDAADRLPFDENLIYVRGDAADPDEPGLILDHCITTFGRSPDTLCLHAGVVESAPILDYTRDQIDRVLRNNVIAAFMLAQEQARRWIAAGEPGLLLFTTSWVQDVPWPGIAAYSASKAALRSLARTFARELAEHHIRSNVIAPGIVAAGMAKQQWDAEPAYQARARRAIPMGALQSVDSVADTILLAVSDLAAYMNGTTLLADGGASLYPMD
jgi:NAD(P)-dependent dehydrogenase (short-subunit alcohol dehydrogenase family)